MKNWKKNKPHSNKLQKLEKHRAWAKKHREKLQEIRKENRENAFDCGRIKAKKSLGQNFLHDFSVVENICKSVEIKDKIIVEIGSGTGFLTREILKNEPKKLVLIEKDTHLFKLLQKTFDREIESGKVEAKNDDALIINISELAQNIYKFDKNVRELERDVGKLDKNVGKLNNDAGEFERNFAKLKQNKENEQNKRNEKNKKNVNENKAGQITIIANLPYNIGTTLVINWLEWLDNIDNIVVMLQKEVVDRICAIPKTKDYGRISVLAQSLCDVKKLFDVKPECFNPRPKVTSSVVKITPKKVSNRPNSDVVKELNRICKVAFSQRRKKLSNVFKNTEFADKFSNDILEKRAEELSVEEYLQLAKIVE